MFAKLSSLIIITMLLSLLVFHLAQSRYPDIDDHLMFQRIDGTQQTFQQLKGIPLVVTFWSPSCVICMHEVEQFNALYRKHEGGSKFELLALSMFYDRPDWVIESSQKAGMQYPVYLDLHKQLSEAFGQVEVTPTSFLLDQQGQIVFRHTGQLDFDTLEQKLTALTG